ncbi:PHP domain-containing protein [Clostridiaceae bacterium 35-E11]
MYDVDMHVHTSASDGIFSPREIVDWGVKLGMKAIAITDHDTIDGVKEAIEISKKYSDFMMIPGIEFSTFYNDIEVHVLGYFIDFANNIIVEITNKIKEQRLERSKKIIQRLRNLQYDVDFAEVCEQSNKGAIGRPHIARILVSKGYVASIEEAFEKLLGRGKPAYAERFKLNVEEAIKIIREAKGIPVLAHPGLIDKTINIETLIHKGFKGIEVFHTKHSTEDSKKYLDLAKKFHLFVTGGSDYHDILINGVPSIGSVGISYELMTRMKESLKNL